MSDAGVVEVNFGRCSLAVLLFTAWESGNLSCERGDQWVFVLDQWVFLCDKLVFLSEIPLETEDISDFCG